MKKIGLFYGKSAKKTAKVAELIAEKFGQDQIDMVPVETATRKDIDKYDLLILGGATWFDGELPTYWDEILPDVERLNMKGKKVAIYGLGDQDNYPENFVDSIGLLANIVKERGGELVGFTSNEDYEYEKSLAETEDGNQFMGLALDFENQQDKNEERINAWIEQLKTEFNLG